MAVPRGRWWALALALGLPCCAAKGCRDDDAPNTGATASATTAAMPSASSVPSSPQPSASASAEAPPARYGVSAISHLPKDCAAAARVEWKVLANHPLLAALLRKALHPDPKDVTTNEQKSFFAFLERSNLDLQRDVEQLALCFDTTGEPLVIVAGSLPKDLIPLLQTLAPKSERYKALTKDGVVALTRTGRSLVQADDRSVVMGPKLEQVLQARSLGAAYGDYALAETGEIAIVAQGDLIKGVFSMLLPQPFGGLAQRTERVQASFSLATQELALNATLPSAEEAEVLKTSLSALAKAQAEQLKNAPQGPKALGLKEAVAAAVESARWEVQDKTLALRVKLPLAALAVLLASK